MGSTKSETISVKVSPEEKGLFKRACTDAALTESDAAREALMLWAKTRGENVQLKSLAMVQERLIEAIQHLSERFDECVQLNVEEDGTVAKLLTQAAMSKTREPEMAAVEN